jgi:predicted O-methyltransferase YrrM
MSFYEAKKYFAYKLKAKNEHSIHSPFVFKLYTEVIRNKENYYAFAELDALRNKLLKNTQVIEVTDLGAGSKKLKNKRSVSEVVSVSVVPKKYGELLFRLVNYFQPKNILELGTSLGLSSMYMHKAAPKAKLTTVEGCSGTHSFARSLLKETGVYLVNDSFENFLDKNINDEKFDLIYIDGNHTYEATIHYFKTLLDHVHNDSVMIFDDIYWSLGMTKAWNEVKAHSSVTVTIDLFKFGIVFFRKENKEKEHFSLRY